MFQLVIELVIAYIVIALVIGIVAEFPKTVMFMVGSVLTVAAYCVAPIPTIFVVSAIVAFAIIYKILGRFFAY